MEDLELMKQQLAALKAKLDRETIVSDRLLRRSMHQRMHWVNRYMILQLCVLLPFVFISFAIMTIVLKLSWWFYAFTCLMTTADAVADYFINNRILPRTAFLTDDLLTLSRKLVRQKLLRWRALAVSLPVLLGWIVWLFVEIGRHVSDAFFRHSIQATTAFGAVVGMTFALYLVWRMQKTNDALLADLGELRDEAGD